VDIAEQEIRVPDATDYDSAELFDYFDDAGLSWAAVNMPTTFPPHGGEHGIMVSGGSAAKGEAYTSPASFQEEIEERFDYKVVPDKDIRSEDAVDEIIDLVDTRFSVSKALLTERDLDFLHTTIFLCNKLHHYFWDDEQTLRVWKCIDRNLEWFINRDLDLLFMSDHGSNEIASEFQINVWLEKKGYLVRESGSKQRDQLANKYGFTQRGLSEFADRLGIRSFARRAVPDRLVDQIPKRGYKKEHKFSPIDWEQTVAIGSGQGLVYLTNPSAKGSDELRSEIATKLEAVKDPVTGNPVAKAVYERDEIYSGQCEYAPDIVFDQSPGIHTEDMVGEYDLFTEPSNWRGENERDGIFMAHGASFKSQGEREPTAITGLAPTILHLNGLAIPEDIDGRPLDIFADATEPADREPDFREPLSSSWTDNTADRRSDKEAVERQLRDLGYLN
jgi:predicted AlkP superfamily phosphohydrolase/phosphomutase